MSKKKHRDKKNNENNGGFGINPQIMEMLKGSNIDMNKISSIMGAMNQDGFDINSLAGVLQNNSGLNMPNSNNSQMDFGNIKSMLNNMDINNNSVLGNNNNFNNNPNNGNFNNSYGTDENIEMLLIIKSVVNPKKARFLERVIEMYKNGEIEY